MTKLCVFLSFILLLSCKSRDNNKDLNGCYQYVSNKDTVMMEISGKPENVSGKLTYAFYEKDRNTGSFKGSVVNGKLFVQYAYMSEGADSKRPLAFKLDGDKLVEGYGETMMENGVTTFVDPDALRFDKGIVLRRINCKNR